MHLDREILSAFLDGEVESPWREAVSEHLAGCDECRSLLSRMEATRRLLREDASHDPAGPMERIRARMLSQDIRRPIAVPLWRRRLSVPIPLAAAASAFVFLMAVALVLALFRLNIGTVHITRAPAGTMEIKIAAPVGNLESLLKTFETQDSSQDVITIPKDYRLTPVGEPLMGTEAEFPRKKQW
jgi:anti-sigma factor RsiW